MIYETTTPRGPLSGNATNQELGQHVGCSMTVLARLLRLCPEGKMDEARWAFHRINWTLYRDAEGPSAVPLLYLSSNPDCRE
jgi:hypothetical protein